MDPAPFVSVKARLDGKFSVVRTAYARAIVGLCNQRFVCSLDQNGRPLELRNKQTILDTHMLQHISTYPTLQWRLVLVNEPLFVDSKVLGRNWHDNIFWCGKFISKAGSSAN